MIRQSESSMFFVTLVATCLMAVPCLPLAGAPKTDPADPVEQTSPKAEKTRASAEEREKLEVVRPNDTAAIKERVGKVVAVEGTVKEAAWSSTGKVMRIDFTEAADSKFMAAAFLKARATLDAAFGGDVAKAVSGKRVRVTGKLQEYKGKPEIMIDKPEQLIILPDAETAAKTAEGAKTADPKK